LPPHVGEIVAGIAARGLVPRFDEVLVSLRDRKILAAASSTK
jgi:hypothetical protein